MMADWFLANFENPAECTPYESAEGGYQWIWGGPYFVLPTRNWPRSTREGCDEWAPAASRHVEEDDDT